MVVELYEEEVYGEEFMRGFRLGKRKDWEWMG